MSDNVSDHACYICFDGEALISPCSCRGTAGYVHKHCLKESFLVRGDLFDLTCKQCRHEFYGDFGVDLANAALHKVQEEHGETSVASAHALIQLSRAFGRVGDYRKQKERLERALTIMEREYGTDHIEVAAALDNLGSALGDLGDYRKQKELLERALLIDEWPELFH